MSLESTYSSSNSGSSGSQDSSPFPAIELSSADEEAVRDQLRSLLQAALDQYETHLLEDNSVVSDSQWKRLLSHDGLTGYSKQHVSPRASDSSKVHSILAIGSIASSVDDLLFGAVNSSPDMFAAFNEVIFRGSVLGSSTLATIESPSKESPERNTTIRWTAHGSSSFLLNLAVTPRDYVVAEATGSTINTRGERIGYRVLHSVNLTSAPELRDWDKHPSPFIRIDSFFAFLYRQISLNDVHLFITGRVDPKGSIPTALAARASAEGVVLLIHRTLEFTRLKKRTHLFRLHQPRRHGGASSVPAAPAASTCRTCAAAANRSKTCQVCERSCCSQCLRIERVVRDPNARDQRKLKVLQKVAFCSQCLATADGLSAWELAVSAAIEVPQVHR